VETKAVEQVLVQLKEDRRKLVEAMAGKYGYDQDDYHKLSELQGAIAAVEATLADHR
jgi:hypothetical protein